MGFALQSLVGMWCCCPGFLDAVWLKEGGLGPPLPGRMKPRVSWKACALQYDPVGCSRYKELREAGF